MAVCFFDFADFGLSTDFARFLKYLPVFGIPCLFLSIRACCNASRACFYQSVLVSKRSLVVVMRSVLVGKRSVCVILDSVAVILDSVLVVTLHVLVIWLLCYCFIIFFRTVAFSVLISAK